jgi:hypothetical protein
MVVRVGVTGHRPKDLRKAKVDLNQLEATVKAVLSKIREEAEKIFLRHADIYAGNGPILRLISPLAEGSDRIVAKMADALNYQLEFPIPFAVDVYQDTFNDTESKAQSIEEFEDLFKKGEKKLVLDGTKEAANQAYEAMGRAMLRHSDVLVSIWDGRPPESGGTGQITSEALKHNIPTIWIALDSPGRAVLLNNTSESGEAGSSTDFESEISKRLNDVLFLPSETEVLALRRFYQEKRPGPQFTHAFKAFYTVLTRQEKSSKQASLAPLATPSLESAFSWADGLANSYAVRHRASFMATYLLGACAVLTAFLGYSRWEDLFKLELLMIMIILAIVFVNRFRHWHDRWIDYRILAEWLRQMRFLHPFSRITPTLKVPAYLGEDDPGPTWFNWYFRACVRQTGIPHAEVDADYVKACRELLLAAIADQEKYHGDKAKNLHLIHHGLHGLTLLAFATTLAACVLHIFFEHPAEALFGEHTALILTTLAIGAPAVGAALEGINHQGEFERMSRRSKAIKNRISDLARQIPADERNFSFRKLGRLAEDFCELQILEQTDWRSVFIGKEVNPS